MTQDKLTPAEVTIVAVGVVLAVVIVNVAGLPKWQGLPIVVGVAVVMRAVVELLRRRKGVVAARGDAVR